MSKSIEKRYLEVAERYEHYVYMEYFKQAHALKPLLDQLYSLMSATNYEIASSPGPILESTHSDTKEDKADE